MIKMNRRQKISVAVVSTAVAFLAVTCVSASPQTSDTPLYTMRMEQASSEMNFLPTAVNEFTYNTRDGYTMNYGFGTDRFAVYSRPIGAFAICTYRTCYCTCCTCCTCWCTCCGYTCSYCWGFAMP